MSAGRFLGFEDDVGCADRVHLHFEVAVPIDPSNAIDDEGFIIGGSSRNRIPWVCGVASHTLVAGNQHVARRCDPLMPEPGHVNFGIVAPGLGTARPLHISNSSGASLGVSFPASTTGPFRWAAFDRVIPNGERGTVYVGYKPSTHLLVHGTLTIASAAPGSPHRVGLSGGCGSINCLPG